MSKDLFLMMREQEIATSFPTKKELEFSSKTFAKNLIDAGDVDKFEMFAQAERLSTAITSVRDELKASLPREKYVAFGIEITPANGRKMPQFAEDEVYYELQRKLKQREELLKVALTSDEIIFDSDGVEVPKVSVKYASDSLQVRY